MENDCARKIQTGVVSMVLALGVTRCDDDVIGAVRPFVSVAPEHLDFGTLELGQESRLPLRLENLSSVNATIRVVIEDDCEGCFLAIDPPANLLGVDDFDVRFRAVRLSAQTATLTVETNEPDGHEPHRVTLIGRGKDTRQPDIDVLPPSVDFGFVPVGGVALRSFVIRSTGTNNLLIDRIRVEPKGAPFRITTATPTPARPGVLAPGAQASVTLRAELTDIRTATATADVFIESNVRREKNVPGKLGWVRVPLSASPNRAPIAVTAGDQTVEPWSRATLDGGRSYDPDVPPNDPLTFRWEFVAKPLGSTAVLERAQTSQPSFWVDLTGRYEIGLVVIDALGLESQNSAVTIVDAFPTNAVRIELVWDHPDADLDLHLIRDGGSFCDCASDTHYRDCAREPNWFPNTPGANPRLDVDDRSGFGPENINIDGNGPSREVMPGRYIIAVHEYASNSGISTWPKKTVGATIRVFVMGLLLGEVSRELEHDGDLWFAGALRWPEKRLEVDGRVVADQICASF